MSDCRVGVAILGATGSIGKSTIDVISRNSDKYKITAVTANRNVNGILELCRQFKPHVAAMADEFAAKQLQQQINSEGLNCEVVCGVNGQVKAATLPQNDTVVAAIVGGAGLIPAYEAVKVGKKILLANKEALVMTGELFMSEAHRSGAQVLPVDSEHNAVFQSLSSVAKGKNVTEIDDKGVKRIILTASGGPFYNREDADFSKITPEEAVAHPNWSMGSKISVDSATMMNKGLEVIEAGWLFDLPASKIDVVIHPQSIVHSMVEYIDGSVVAQLGNPDMRTPIAHALAWPQRVDAGVESLDFCKMTELQFFEPDNSRFPCLGLAYRAMKNGGSMPTVLNAANEIAVAAFLQRGIRFDQIATVVSGAMNSMEQSHPDSIDDVLRVDSDARSYAKLLVENGC
ncbi:MAG: 1-deoxy-D-xylulose-5-phosphate reductoisomerase [Gammaproteobacteria bacterium]|nr:MAG: 1-deoxy-D-xylulose-5-phosphate reductoisomerase [Gammaproteobacteria bacterium]